ncbi:hypothetical protein ABZX40_16370 [Streptomyces sp. NPDC004610]|uniref:hypothetical protein n=1 Tax=unclassified Streptomyces TaxID=2593676 RepID=UPI0033A83EF9
MERSRRVFGAVPLALLPVMVVAGPVPAAASAAPVLVTCAGTTTVAFSPGLTDEERTVGVSGQDVASICLSLTNPGLTGFVGPFSGTATQSCTSLFAGGSGTETLHWNNGTSSTWSYTNSFSNVNGTKVGTSTGPITSGTLSGAEVTQTITYPNLDLTACSTAEGLTFLSGVDTWTITRS